VPSTTPEDVLKRLVEATHEAKATVRELHEARKTLLETEKAQRRRVDDMIANLVGQAVKVLGDEIRNDMLQSGRKVIDGIAADWRGQPCDPVRRPDGKCVVSTRMATALVRFADGSVVSVNRRRLRLVEKGAAQ
jgi:hypothetical protein